MTSSIARFREWLSAGGCSGDALLVANLPYNVATPILVAAIEARGAIGRSVATVQREVARRFIARPGDEAYGYLSVRTAAYATGRILFDLPPGAFRPRPKVVSSVLELSPREAPLEPGLLRRALCLASLGFNARRKTLANALASAAPRVEWERALEALGKTGPARAEELALNDYLALARGWRTVGVTALEVVPLGGVGEFGRNVLWLRCGESSILVDVGVSFPDESFPGIDRIAPDLSILREERDRRRFS